MKKNKQEPKQEEQEEKIFDIDQCRDLGSIEEKLLELTSAEKQILEKYKNSIHILQPKVFWQLHDSVVATFNHYRTLLNIRRELILGQAKTKEETEKLLTEIRENKRKAIADRFLMRKLKYENWLFKQQSAVQFKIDKANLKKAHKAAIAPLKALLAQQKQEQPQQPVPESKQQTPPAKQPQKKPVEPKKPP